MECIKNCSLCNNLILSQNITFDGTNLVVNLPNNTYESCEKYCIVLAQTIPTTTTINAPIVFTIGSDTSTVYPFVNQDCTSIYAFQVKTRKLYPVRVSTAVNTQIFKYVGKHRLSSNSTTVIEASS